MNTTSPDAESEREESEAVELFSFAKDIDPSAFHEFNLSEYPKTEIELFWADRRSEAVNRARNLMDKGYRKPPPAEIGPDNSPSITADDFAAMDAAFYGTKAKPPTDHAEALALADGVLLNERHPQFHGLVIQKIARALKSLAASQAEKVGLPSVAQRIATAVYADIELAAMSREALIDRVKALTGELARLNALVEIADEHDEKIRIAHNEAVARAETAESACFEADGKISDLEASLALARALLTHIYHEVSTLDDFDAESLRHEIDEAMTGTKVFDDNKALHARLTELETANATLQAKLAEAEGQRRTKGTVEVCAECNGIPDGERCRSDYRWSNGTTAACPIRTAAGEGT